MSTFWDDRYAHRIQTLQSSAISELFKLVQQPDVISFAGGLPAPEVFPVYAMKTACDMVLDTLQKHVTSKALVLMLRTS